MKPPKRDSANYEKVKIGDMLPGTITEVKYDEKHTFKGFQGAADTVSMGVRFTFTLDGYKHPHYSRWMKFNYGSKANLYAKYLAKLVNNAKPDMDFDLDLLKGMRVKTLWSENGDFQNIDSIFPESSKASFGEVDEHHEEVPPVDEDGPEATPF